MLAEKVFKMLSQLIMMILLARFLGPGQLGSLMYCYAIASTFIFLNILGLDSILVKIFIERSNKQHSFLKHALIMRIIGALISVILINVIGIFLVDDNSRILLFIISLYHLFMPLNVYEWFYQAQGRGDLSAYGLIAGHVFGFLFRLSCLYLGGDTLWLGAAYLVEMASMGLCYLLIAKLKVQPKGGLVSSQRMTNLLKDSAPLIVSGVLVLLYMKTDQLMLGYMVNSEEVGIYVAATRLSEAWFFVGLTVIAVYFPKLVETLNNLGQKAYEDEIIKKGGYIVWGAILLAIFTTLISPQLILLFYGPEFKESSSVLMVTIWTVPFVYLGTISTKMYIILNKKREILYRGLSGLTLNLFLNYFMIPHYGALGAGIGSLLSQVFASYIFNLFLVSNNVFKVQTKILFMWVFFRFRVFKV